MNGMTPLTCLLCQSDLAKSVVHDYPICQQCVDLRKKGDVWIVEHNDGSLTVLLHQLEPNTKDREGVVRITRIQVEAPVYGVLYQIDKAWSGDNDEGYITWHTVFSAMPTLIASHLRYT